MATCCDNPSHKWDYFCSNCGRRHIFERASLTCDRLAHELLNTNYCRNCGASRDELTEEMTVAIQTIVSKVWKKYKNNGIKCSSIMIDKIRRDVDICIPTPFYFDTITKTVRPVETIYEKFPKLRWINRSEFFDVSLTDWLYVFESDLEDEESKAYKKLKLMNDNIAVMDEQLVPAALDDERLTYEERMRISNTVEEIMDEHEVEKKANKRQKVV